jgi:nitrogen regulatory protein P-II 1
MKRIEAVIPQVRLEAAFAALKELDLGGLTYYDSKGRGQLARPQLQSGRGTSVYTPEFNVNSTIMLVVNDTMVDRVVDKLISSTGTGLAGEGKIFVSEVEDVIDIGSSKRGEAAL